MLCFPSDEAVFVFFFLVVTIYFHSGATLIAAPVPGQIVKMCPAMMVTSAHMETRVAVASAQPRLSLVTPCVSTVMATAAVSTLDSGS